MSQYKPSSACCSTPAIIGPPYSPKGKFEEIDGMKSYVVGPTDAKKAVFMLYDVFGYSGQILEGADKLGEHYYVVMPEFFGDAPAPLEWMPLDESVVDEGKLDEFCETRGESTKTIEKMMSIIKAVQASHPSIEQWGLVGYCWGGYTANVALSQVHFFKAAAVLHAGFPEEIAGQITTPLLALCSKDEPEKEFAAFKKNLTVESYFEVFHDQLHGWLSARGDLADPAVRKEYDRGYDMILQWLGKYM